MNKSNKKKDRKTRMDRLMSENEMLSLATDTAVQAFLEFSQKIDAEIQCRIENGEYEEWAQRFMTPETIQRIDDEPEFAASVKNAISQVISADVVLEMKEYGYYREEDFDPDYKPDPNCMDNKSMSDLLADIVDIFPDAEPVQILLAFGELSDKAWFDCNGEHARLYASSLIRFRMNMAGHESDFSKEGTAYLAAFSAYDMAALIELDSDAADFIYDEECFDMDYDYEDEDFDGDDGDDDDEDDEDLESMFGFDF